MPRGSKEKYTEKQKRQAEQIEQGYRSRGVSEEEAERRAWATVNKMSGGGNLPGGSGRGKKTNPAPAKKGGRKAAQSRTAAERSASAKKAARTRARNKAARSRAAKKAAKSRKTS